jgi:hypothetical protein
MVMEWLVQGARSLGGKNRKKLTVDFKCLEFL